MIAANGAGDTFDISARFRRMVEARIARLDRDADRDELNLTYLEHPEHISRHMRLVAAQRAEARRMRLFLERCRVRPPRPMVAL